MKRVRFGRTGVEIPTVGLGTWAHGGAKIVNGRPVGWWGTDEREARKSLVRAAELGIDHWDTADVYGDGRAERLIGAVWDDVSRDRVFLASKVGWDPGSYPHYYHPDQMRRQLEGSLRNLKTDSIDLYYLHHCNFGPDDRHLEAAVETMRRFREEGKVRWIGLSDWRSENIARYLEAVDPDAVQCYRNVMDDSYARSGLQEKAEERDLGVAFFSPLKHALLLGQFEGPVTFGEGDHRNGLSDFRNFGLLAHLRRCRAELERRFGQVTSQPVLHALVGALLTGTTNTCVLVGLRKASHTSAAGAVGDELDRSEAAWVQQLFQSAPRSRMAR